MKRLWSSVALCLTLFLAPTFLHGADVVKVYSEKTGDRLVFFAENTDPWAPYHLTLKPTRLDNMRASVILPYQAVIPPGRKINLFFMEPIDPRKESHTEFETLIGLGDPNAIPDKEARYVFPWEHGKKHELSQGYFGEMTHQDCYCLDFEMDEGTPLCAAREGLVIDVKDDSTMHGPGPQFEKFANYVTVLHEDGTAAGYGHISRGGSRVRSGERVAQGQVIALSGNTGQSSGPHLHFTVSRFGWDKQTTIPCKFLSLDGQVIPPVEGKYYYSVHPGGAAFTAILAENIREEELELHQVPVTQTGKVSFRTEELDNRIYFYCANGTGQDQEVTLDFSLLRLAELSKKAPLTKRVPPMTEVYFLTLTQKPYFGPSFFQWNYKWRRSIR